MFSLSYEDKQEHSSWDALASIGYGHLLRIVEPDAEIGIFRWLVSSLENQLKIQK